MMHEGWVVVAEVGLWGWIGAALGFIFQAFPGKNMFNTKKAAAWGAVVVVLYAVWVIGMLQA